MVKRLLIIATFLSVAGLILGIFARWMLLADLACQFRMHLAMMLLVFALVLCLDVRHRKIGFAAFLIGITFLASVWPFIWLSKSGKSQGDYKLMSFNLLVENQQAESVLGQIKSEDPDLIVLLEYDSKWQQFLEKRLDHRWPFKAEIVRNNPFGIAIFSKYEITDIERYCLETFPVLSARISVGDRTDVRLIGAHPPPPLNSALWKQRNRVFEVLANATVEGDVENTLIAGDLNCVPWSPFTLDLEQRSGLLNAFRGRGPMPSWGPGPSFGVGLPIDQILTGEKIKVRDCKLGNPSGSDHRPVIITFD